MKVFFLIFFSFSLFANDILTNYRLNGIDAVQKQLDLELTRESYWQKYLKDRDLKFGYIENHSYILACNKEKSYLSLYKKNLDGRFEFKQKYDALTGKIRGDKSKEGDYKTPIGIYNITKKIYKLDSFYGPLALVTSYPNLYDKYRGKNGSGIWIHGLPTSQDRDDYTKGCIAIGNSNLRCLDDRIDIEKTLILINKKEIKEKANLNNIASLLAQLYEWRFDWINNNIDGYLDFYSYKFIRYDGMKLSNFKKYKTRIFNKNEKKSIIFKNINVIPYPNNEKIYKISFKELYEASSFRFSGDKILIVKLDKQNNMKIITEK